MNKHYKELMKEGYKLLTSKNPKFPAKFSREMKVNLYDNVMEYYKTNENFEYCTQLSQSLNNIK